jgi:hypothetical protein
VDTFRSALAFIFHEHCVIRGLWHSTITANTNAYRLYFAALDRQGTVQAKAKLGRAVAQAVSRRPPTAEARVRSRVSPCGIFGGQSGTVTGFSPSTSVFPCQFHSTAVPLLRKGQKNNNHHRHLHHRVAQEAAARP